MCLSSRAIQFCSDRKCCVSSKSLCLVLKHSPICVSQWNVLFLKTFLCAGISSSQFLMWGQRNFFCFFKWLSVWGGMNRCVLSAVQMWRSPLWVNSLQFACGFSLCHSASAALRALPAGGKFPFLHCRGAACCLPVCLGGLPWYEQIVHCAQM